MFSESGAAVRFPSVVSTDTQAPPAPQVQDRFEPGELATILWRRRAWIVLGMIAALIAAVLFLATVPARYAATAQLLIDPNDLRVVDNAVTSSSTPSDANTAYVESQARVLTSDKVLRKVIEKLNLTADVEFVASPSILRMARDVASGMIGLPVATAQPDPVVAALQDLARKVSARRQERTYVVDLSVSTREAEKSALIANAIVRAYLDDLAFARTDAARRATDALSGRLAELRDRVREAEDRSETYKAQNNIVAASGQLVNEQQLAELSNQLTVATAKADETKARLDQIEALRRGNSDAGATSEAVQSQTIAALRAQQAEVVRRRAELTARLGERHPSVTDVNAQARDIQQAIDREVARLAQAARGDYERALATRQSLARRLDGLKQEAMSTSQALVKLRELDRDVEASRAIYQSYLTRSRETSEQERVNTANVRVLADANTPDTRAFPPRGILVLLAALMFGAFAGAGAGFARDWVDDRVHSRRDLEAVCRYPVLAEIPPLAREFERKGVLSRLRARRHGTTMMATLLDAPGSAFAKSIHRLRYVLRAPAAPHFMLFLSAGEAGARAEIALNLALATATNQPRVILVDADMGRRGISRRVVGGGGEGLADVAADKVKLDAALITEPQTRLRVLQAGGAPATVLNPDATLKVLEQARTADTVIVDGPSGSLDPLSPALAVATDFAVLVVTAGVTRARDIVEFQRSTDFPPGKIRGVVFVSDDGAAF